MHSSDSDTQVTIILPVYNGERYLAEAVQSVFLQTFQEWELLIINDGSVDATERIAKTLASGDSRVKYIQHVRNQGLIASLNEGVALARGKYLARLDCDDTWLTSDKLSTQFAFLEAHPGYGLVGTSAVIVDETGGRVLSLWVPASDSAIRSRMLLYNPFVHSSVCMRTGLVRLLGGYAKHVRYVEDYDLWLRIGGTGALLANIPETMVGYRVSPEGITQSHRVEQIRQCVGLVWCYKGRYPNWPLGLAKWFLQYTFFRIGIGFLYLKIVQRWRWV